MAEINEVFTSLSHWKAWAEGNRFVYNAEHANELASSVVQGGFVEPMFGDRVLSHEIKVADKNWREGLVARGLNSRSRAVVHLIDEAIREMPRDRVRIFATEAVTDFALRFRGRFPRFLGSEYAMDERAKEELFPIPHQDLLELTLPSNSFDIVTTNEVLEHVPSIDGALSEIHRVLKPGGWHMGTHPFWFMNEDGDVRTIIRDGKLVQLKEPEYHGNPVDPAGGSIVFETPGWNILARARQIGFNRAEMRFVASVQHGILTENTGVFVFCAQK